MQVASSTLSFQSQHSTTLAVEVSQSLQAWIGSRAAQAAAPAPVTQISGQGQAALAAEHRAEAQHVKESDEGEVGDPRLSLIRTLVEMLTGRKIRVMTLEEASGSDSVSASADTEVRAAAGQAASQGQSQAGWGVVYDAHARISESEQTTFSATGVVRTADGREISFRLDLSMSRSWTEESSTSLRAGDARRTDPLVLSFGGSAAQLTDARFSFDLEGNGQASQVAALGGNSAYLAFDANGNGTIDSGKELFGPTTGSGFGELAQLDADGNGWIDEGDAAYVKLLLWRPGEGGGSLQGLKEAGVGAIALAHQATPFELRGSSNADLGAVRDSGVFLGEDGQAGAIQEIDLTV